MKIIIEGIEMRDALFKAATEYLNENKFFIAKEDIVDLDYDIDGNSWVVHLDTKDEKDE